MQDFSNPTEAELIASANLAMLCSIRPNMRRIDIKHIDEEKKVIIVAYFDKEPSEDEIEEISCIETEMLCQTTGEITFEHHILHLPYPAKIAPNGICVYRRYEPNPAPEPLSQLNVLVAANKAMHGRIHENVREIDAVYDPKTDTMDFVVYFDTSPSDNQVNDIDAIMAEMRGSFDSRICWRKKIIVLPFPATIPRTSAIYYRFEPW